MKIIIQWWLACWCGLTVTGCLSLSTGSVNAELMQLQHEIQQIKERGSATTTDHSSAMADPLPWWTTNEWWYGLAAAGMGLAGAYAAYRRSKINHR